MNAWKHLRAILLLPVMVTVVIPAGLVYSTGLNSSFLRQAVPGSRFLFPVLGVLSVGLGLALMIATIRLFATVGHGTLAPWNPTQRLVVRGVYRRVRNPMISGVVAVLLGEALLTASLPLAGWFLTFAFINAVYIPLSEEPGLARRFGDEYEEYRRNVPRWVPRLRAWTPDASSDDKSAS